MFDHRTSSKLLGVLLRMAWISLGSAQEIPEGPYLGQNPPGLEPEVFAPGIVTLANRFEFNGSITPNGREFYFTVSSTSYTANKVMVTYQKDGVWTTPAVAPFSGWDLDWGIYPSPDGRRLFFSSGRPSQSWDVNIWMCEREGADWGEPTKLALNSPAGDYAGTCTWDGTHYFGSLRNGLISIFRSVPVAGEYSHVERLPYPINTGGRDLNPYIAPDESYLIFASDRGDNQDLYISYRNEDDSWTEPLNLGLPVSSQDSEWNPFLSPDGQYLFFARSTGTTSAPQNVDLYWVHAGAVLPDATGPIHNLSSEQRFRSIQCAIRHAKAGDTLVVEPGVYHESFALEKDITLQSVDPDDPYYVGGTIIQADVDEPVLTLTGRTGACEIAGLTLRAGSVGVAGVTTDAIFRNCRIMDNVTHGMELSEGSAPHLLGCLITANGQAGIQMHTKIGGRAPLYCEPIIENCAIVDNGQAGMAGGQPVIVDSVIQGQ